MNPSSAYLPAGTHIAVGVIFLETINQRGKKNQLITKLILDTFKDDMLMIIM